jgi:hypothetical protein
MPEELPEHLREVVTPVPERASATEVATALALELDDAMQEIYETARQRFEANIVANCPIILGLFSGEGGSFTLYRPGLDPVEAPPPPVGYQVVKSISHSSMAVYQLVGPFLGDPETTAWHGPMQVYRLRQQQVLDTLGDLDLPDDVRGAVEHMLTENIRFMDSCLERGTFALGDIEEFARGLKPALHTTIGFAAKTQVSHWMGVLDEWKAEIGDAWEHTYGVTNSLYVTRTNNILFTAMAQYFGREAFNDRLLLFETTAFDTTPEMMINLLARIIADRALGEVFFKDYFLMDVELLSSGARDAVTDEMERRVPASSGAYTVFSGRDQIVEEARQRGLEPLMPPLAPFHSRSWPWRTDAAEGEGPSRLEDVT